MRLRRKVCKLYLKKWPSMIKFKIIGGYIIILKRRTNFIYDMI